MVNSEPEADTSKKLLRAEKLDETAGLALRKCESCGVLQVPVGPCFTRDQALSGFSNPNIRICIYAARRPLHADVYPPFDQSTKHALGTQLEFTPRSESKQQEENYKKIRDIDLNEDHVREVSEKFEKNQVVVLKAPTGYGKSTKLPYWLCWHEFSKFSKNSGKVIVTEPKRLAAEGVAGTVSMAHQNRGPAPGLDVGLQHGEVSSSGESNKLLFVTDGSLINRLIKRELEDVQLIIVDEAHERNERIELILLILRFLLPQYPHLKLLILSATIDPENFTTYFQPQRKDDTGNDDPGVHFISTSADKIDWKPKEESHKVEEAWSEGEFKAKFDVKTIKTLVNKACEKAESGHVLVFLPGAGEIDELHRQIKDIPGFEIQQLMGKTSQEKRGEIQRCKASEKKLIILATNVAESSVTFTDLSCVVDSGLSKRSTNDDLELVQISQAEQRQRRGRVGRNRDGFYFAAFSEESKENFKPYPDSHLVDLSDYHREVMLLQAMSVGIDPTTLAEPLSYLMKPDKLKEPTRRVIDHIRKRGGLAGEKGDEYLTPVGLLAAQAGVSVELARLLLIGDHHNVLTEMSAVVANMASRREDRELAGVDVTDLLPDHDDSVSPSESQNDLVHDIVHKFQQVLRLPKFQRILKVLFTSLLRLFFGQPDEDQAVDEDFVADDLWVRRDVVGDLRDSYLLQSFDKIEEKEFADTAALMSKQAREKAQKDAYLRLEKTNRIQQQFQERVPEDRLREIDPRLFKRVQLAVDCWRTDGWCFELSLVADANLLHIGSKKVKVGKDKKKNKKKDKKRDVYPKTATRREKNLQTLWELEGLLTRSRGSKADRLILGFARSLREENRECRVVSGDSFKKDEYKGEFKDLKDSDHERRCNPESVSGQLKEYLQANSQHEQSRRIPLEVIVDMSNVCRRDLHQDVFAPRADLNRIVELMDRLGSAAEKSTELHRDPRNSLISNLGRHGDFFEGEVLDSTREDLVPELSRPVGSRWCRIEGTEEVERKSASEQDFIDSLSSGEAHSLLPKAGDDVADERTSVEHVMGVLNEDLTKNCFFVDTLKKHYLTNPAKHAQRIRKQSENQPIRLPERDRNFDYFRVLRAPGSKEPKLIPSYLESEAIKEMISEGLQEVQFSVHRDLENEHYVTGKQGEVKSVKVKLKMKKDGKAFFPIVELGAWQVCPWWSAVPDQKEYASQQPKKGEKKQIRHSRMPEKLLEFGEHTMEIVRLGRLDRLLCTTYDKTGERSNFVKEMQVLEGESVESQRERIAKAATAFKKSHENSARVWAQPKTETITIPLDKVGAVIGQKGKVIKKIEQETGAVITVDDSGSVGIVTIGSHDAAKVEDAKTRILNIVDPPTAELGATYTGRVVNIKDFGAFVNILPGRDGLIPISKLGNGQRVARVEDVLKLGDEVSVRVDKIDYRGKVRLSLLGPDGQPTAGSVKPSGWSTTRASRAKSSSPSRAKKSSRRWIWVTLIGLGGIVLWMQFSSFRESNDYSDFVPEAPVTQAPATTVFPPRTADDWFVALNCVEDPSERDIGRVATAVFVCYSESNPERHSISLFRYDDQPAQSELNRRVERACTKRGPTGEVFAFYSPGQPGFFVYTIYADAVARSRMPDLFERLSC